MARTPDYTEALRYLKSADPVLGALIHRVGPCQLTPHTRRSPFQALVKSVVFQQLNGAVADIIFNRVKKLFPHRAFPTPDDLLRMPEPMLRGAGLSRAKTLALKDIAAQTVAGVVPDSAATRKLSDEELVQRLTQVRGVGPWTVEMFLIFTLGRMDVLPATDYGVRKGFALTYGWKELPKPSELLEAGQKWRPWRTVAAWYFWRALDLEVPD